jgi:hypothetical protein
MKKNPTATMALLALASLGDAIQIERLLFLLFKLNFKNNVVIFLKKLFHSFQVSGLKSLRTKMRCLHCQNLLHEKDPDSNKWSYFPWHPWVVRHK